MGQSWLRNSARSASTLLACTLACFQTSPSLAQTLDIAQTPLASASNLSVLPNLMFILDDSGSMTFDALPDHTERVQGGSERRYWHENYNCKAKTGITTEGQGELGGKFPNHCERTDPPFGAVEFNGMYYNPQFTYRPPLNADGTSYPNQSSWNAVTCDPFSSKWKCKDWYNVGQGYYDSATTTIEVDSRGRQSYTNKYTKQWYGSGDTFDVQTQWPEIVYCAGDTNDCRRNGINTGNPFRYTDQLTGAAGGGYPDATYNYPKLRRGAPHYYTIEAVDFCSNTALTNCNAGEGPDAIRSRPLCGIASRRPMPIAWRRRRDSADNTDARACRKRYRRGGRLRLSALRPVPPRRHRPGNGDLRRRAPLRTDCAARPVCTYAEELTNFANWFAYYRTRMQMMKTATGRRVHPDRRPLPRGLRHHQPGQPGRSSDRFLKIDELRRRRRRSLVRQALRPESARRHAAAARRCRASAATTPAVTDGINQGMDDDPLQYSCQQNFALLTTDGYWNGRRRRSTRTARPSATSTTTRTSLRARSTTAASRSIRTAGSRIQQLGHARRRRAVLLPDRPAHERRQRARWAPTCPRTTCRPARRTPPTGSTWSTFALGMVDGPDGLAPDYESSDAIGDFDNVARAAQSAHAPGPAARATGPCPAAAARAIWTTCGTPPSTAAARSSTPATPQAVQDGLNTALTNLQRAQRLGRSGGHHARPTSRRPTARSS